jgi:hypothetical protein
MIDLIPQGVQHTHGFDIGDGYEWVARRDKSRTWRSISCYGLDGWDAGDWPLVAFAVTNSNVLDHATDRYLWGYAVRVEGDVDTYWYPTQQERDVAVGLAIHWYWQRDSTITGYLRDKGAEPKTWQTWDDIPDRYKGYFSWKRLEASKADVS